MIARAAALSLLLCWCCIQAAGSEEPPLFRLALELFGSRTAAVHRNSSAAALQQVHIIRVPKASSSSLSMVARRIVGCQPPGPCCKWPGDPPGSCPAKGLFECETRKKVIGCTHHHPNYDSLINRALFSMTVLREPVSRSVSAFGYGGHSSIHFNSKCSKANDTACAEAYINSLAWTNIAVKLFSGHYAYAEIPTCASSNDCKASLQLALRNLQLFNFLGITEMWQLSLLVLHAKLPHLPPNRDEFLSGGKKHAEQPANGLRVSSGNRLSILSTNPALRAQLEARNTLDRSLYQAAVERLCKDLHDLHLWQHEIVRTSWWRDSKTNATLCLPSSVNSSSLAMEGS